LSCGGIRASRENPDRGRRYRLAGLLRCGICGRRLESCWANSRAAYRCRHGYSSTSTPDPARPKNRYIREDHILPHLPALFVLLSGTETAAGRRRRRTRQGTDVSTPVSDAKAISYLRSSQITLTYDQLVTDNGGAFKAVAFARFIASRPELLHIRTRAKSPGQNGVRERGFGSLKYEHLYRVHEQIATVEDLYREAEEYRAVFNDIRPHEALGFHRPAEILRDPSLHPIHKNQTRDLVPEA
jgi:hypothetical protein